jgi:hypothetical protein
MRRALLFLSLRSWRSHKLRIAITILSVCIAVSFVALQTVNLSLEHSLEAVPCSGKSQKPMQTKFHQRPARISEIEGDKNTVGWFLKAGMSPDVAFKGERYLEVENRIIDNGDPAVIIAMKLGPV